MARYILSLVLLLFAFNSGAGEYLTARSETVPGGGGSPCDLNEQAWAADNQQFLLDVYFQCVNECGFGDPTCVGACMQGNGVPLGAICMTCLDTYYSCVIDNCTGPCNAGQEACEQCQDQFGCRQALVSCMGQTDADGDGWWAGSDCDDNDPVVHPTAAEVCDGVDNDCDGLVDEGIPVFYADADGDGFGDPLAPTCLGTGVNNDLDCDDTDPAVFPGQDCFGQECGFFNGVQQGTCGPDTYCFFGWCLPCADDDGDGFTACGSDCDDNDPAVSPGAAELCDGLDNDCDGLVDEDFIMYVDAYGDGYGVDGTESVICTPGPGLTFQGGDCDDTNVDIFPGVPELCGDGIDNDCNGTIDDQTTWYEDADGDGYGTSSSTLLACEQPQGYSPNPGDCDDNNNGVYPLAGPGIGCASCSLEDQQYIQEQYSQIWNITGVIMGDIPQGLTGQAAWNALLGGLQPFLTAISTTCQQCVVERAFCAYTSCATECVPWLLIDGDLYPGSPACNQCVSLGGCSVAFNACVGLIDLDGDGYLSTNDCDDLDPAINPAADELCDGLDNDCDGAVDEGIPVLYADADGDGFGDPLTPTCLGTGVNNNLDCDDTDPAVFPGQDCFGQECGFFNGVQQGTCGPDTYCFFGWCLPCADADGDGLTTCDGDCNDNDPNLTVFNASCDDGDPNTTNDVVTVNCTCQGSFTGNCPPGEIADCNGNCAPAEWVGDGTCDDGSFEWEGNFIFFNCAEFNNDGSDCGSGCTTEVCDGQDNDCDGQVDEDFMWYPDADGDGWGANVAGQLSCTPVGGSVTQTGDCDDANASIFPGASDLCSEADGIDNDCNGLADDQDGVFWYVDADGDGWGNEEQVIQSCTQVAGTVALAGDCDDSNDALFPGAVEQCDGVDNDCDGEADEDFFWYADADGDGFGDLATGAFYCSGPPAGHVQIALDCDDSDPNTFPGAPEGCDGVDRNCDGVTSGTNGTEVYSPNWTATATTGATVELYDLLAQGKTVVLDLFAAWCPPSQQMLTANFLQDWNAHMGPDGTDQIRIVAIAVDQSAGNVTPFIDEAQWPVIVQDGESFGPLYAAIGMYDNAVPTLLMICPDRSVTMLYPQNDALPYTGLFVYDPTAGLAVVSERCACRDVCLTNVGCMDVNACDYDPNATCPGPCAQSPEWFVDNDGDGVGGASLGTACTQPANSAPVGGDCDDNDPSAQVGFDLYVLSATENDFGSAHYVITQGATVIEGDIQLPEENQGIGGASFCIGAGCFSIQITPNDVPLGAEAFITPPGNTDEVTTFSTTDGFYGSLSDAAQEVCDGIDNDCDGTTDEGCGNCSEADRAWILANQATIDAIVGSVLLDCIGQPDYEGCLLDALLNGTPLPAGCASCVAQRYACITSSCLSACLGGFESPNCQACVQANCNASFFACAGFTDNDGDGFVAEQDCDDSNPDVYPGANELCDTIDNDCDGQVDETPTIYFVDSDGDGWGDENNTVEAGCDPPNGTTSQAGDCDDSNADIFPGAPELCNGIDDDCDGEVDDFAGTAYYVDADGDGYGNSATEEYSCTPIPGRITTGGDCDDSDDSINPGAADPCDAIDQDCSGGPVLSTWYQDNDGDGFGNEAVVTQDCTQPSDHVATGGDCDDTNSDVFPGNGCSNCTLVEQAWIAANQQVLLNALTSCAATCFNDPACLAACMQSEGVPAGAICLSCVEPLITCTADNCSILCLGSPELCFFCQVQQGCMGQLAACMGQVDADGDGWWAGSDCDDANASVFPYAVEVCDGLDNDCDGSVDEGLSVTYYTDADGDGFGVDGTEVTGTCEQPPGTATQGGDCDDANDTVYPGAPELCDGIDNDCDEQIDNEAGTLYYTDADGDSYGDDATAVFSCTPVPGAVTVGGDCNDGDAGINPGAADPCDSIDQDCSGGPVIATWYQDLDGDGYGNSNVSQDDCSQPVDYVPLNGDCDDTNSGLFPGNGCSNCTGTEQAWLATNQQTLLNDMMGCMEACLFTGDGCIVDCLVDVGIPVGALCLTCVEEYLSCWQSNCVIQCLNSEEACIECQLGSGCFGQFATCLGMTDADGDGWWAGSDCDDNDPAIHPGASEVCNGIDDDCDGVVDDNTGDAYYADNDGDGFGDDDVFVLSCTPVPGMITQGGDCNDADPDVNPLGTELCNSLDDDCDGEVDEDFVCDPPDPCADYILELRSDGGDAAGVTYEVLDETGTSTVLSGNNPIPANSIGTLTLCLPDGCYQLRVTDAAGDGLLGYVLREMGANGRRLIDNSGNMSDGVSAIANGGTFCVPLGDDRPIFSSCDKLDWVNNKFIVCHANAAVSAQYGVTNTTSGYEFWFFDPNGSYSYRRFRSHATSDGTGSGATRACHFKVNGWFANVANPHLPANILLNVRVRGRVAGTNLAFGPACQFKIDPVLAACPRVKLQDDPANTSDYSCGVSRNFGGGSSPANRIYANPPQPIPVVASSAVRYQFRFRITGENVCIVRPPQTSARLVLNWTTGTPLECSKTYEVDVRVSLDGGATWCFGPAGSSEAAACADSEAWGKVCLVTINPCAGVNGGTNALIGDNGTTAGDNGQGERSVALHPNPNRGDQLFLSVTKVDEGVNTVSVDILDLTGQRVMARTIAVTDGYVNTNLELRRDLGAGLYLVNITAGDKTYTERLVIQP